ncbi:hypothetical protein B0T26DRAFT_631980 [Lasiosphaeria miniovina]|uniref:AA1-like domain-containing protein n=1 Tax=Lasiosphaeria miniovina TaxID=1954250 RepID=A0AA40ED82_9PEZI|nr:uncharacterized protein B0T26DRAFT_631980 [Lasiosphaeria miniovina]KAK0734062.1 hypothetical protein B0T26DRAFT_631980 [Lasiosphaeria miniovina]
MLILSLVSALAVSLPFAAAKPAYKIPAIMSKLVQEDDTCIMPEGFRIQKFRIWSPQAGSNRSVNINFEYTDDSTSINTCCHLNQSSASVGPPGLTPRYACNNDTVQFIWQNGTMTVVEKACPQTSSHFEAAGSVTLNLTCTNTLFNSTAGAGSSCVSTKDPIEAIFTSLEPTPQ